LSVKKPKEIGYDNRNRFTPDRHKP
jgi:hypothetical protein